MSKEYVKNSVLTLLETSSFHSFIAGGRLSRAFTFSVKRLGGLKLIKHNKIIWI